MKSKKIVFLIPEPLRKTNANYIQIRVFLKYLKLQSSTLFSYINDDNSKFYGYYFCFKYLIKQYRLRKTCVVYSRNAYLIVWSNILGFSSVIEIHNSFLTKNRLMNSFLIWFLLRNNNIKFVFISAQLRDFFFMKGISYSLNAIIEETGFDDCLYQPANNVFQLKSEKIEIAYIGKVQNRSLEMLIKFARLNPGYIVNIVGSYSKLLENLPVNIHFHGFLEKDSNEFRILLGRQSLLIGLWGDKIETYNFCSPIKAYEYAAFQIPFVLQDLPVLITSELFLNRDIFFNCDYDSMSDKILSIINSVSYEHIPKDLLMKYSASSRTKRIFDFIQC